MSRFLRSCCSCFWKNSTAAATRSQLSRNLAFEVPELKPVSLTGAKCEATGRRPGLLHRIFHRRTKEEEILLFEKRYLKKFLQHYNLYLDHMTLSEMRLAKRCLEESISFKQCPRCAETPTSRASPKTPRKHVSFHRDLVQQSKYIPVTLFAESSDDSEEEISTHRSLPVEGLDFGPFLLGGDNGPTYVSFEQPEP